MLSDVTVKRFFPVLMLSGLLLATGCPQPEDPLTPEELAEGAYGISAITRDGLFLWRLQLADQGLVAPAVEGPDEAGGSAAAALMGAQMALPTAGQTWTDAEGNVYVIREVAYDGATGIALITVEVTFVPTNPAASAEQIYEIHTNFTPADDNDDRFLSLEMNTDYRDGTFETLNYVDLDRQDGNCDVQVDCDINVGRIGLVLTQYFDEDPHLAEYHYEIDVAINDPATSNDDEFERELYQITRTDQLTYSQEYLPVGAVAPGEIPQQGTIVQILQYGNTAVSDATGISQTTSWENQMITTVQTQTQYTGGGVDDYLVSFNGDGTGTISGSRRDDSTVTGTIDRPNGRHTMRVTLVDGSTVDVVFQALSNAVVVTRSVETPRGSYSGVGNISVDMQTEELVLDYTDTRGYKGEGVLEPRATDFILRNAEVATPDKRELQFDLTVSTAGEGTLSFHRGTVSGDLVMVPVGGAAGVLERGDVETDIQLDAAGRIQP